MSPNRHHARSSRFAILVLLASFAVTTFAAEGQFSAALRTRLQADALTEIDLGKVGPFAWEDMYIFHPRTTREENCKVVAVDWFECRFTFPSVVGDDEYFLVFRRKGQIIRAERHPRGNGAFSASSTRHPQPVLAAAAVFRVEPASSAAGEPAFRLEYKRQE
ncbi:MAG: hypothetical protein ABI650_12060 [Dokdonella sp.]